MSAGGKWKIPAGAGSPDGFLLGHLAGTTGNKLHLGPAEPYTSALCGVGLIDTIDTAGPQYHLCTACAKAAGIPNAAALPVDEASAAWWAMQGYGEAS